MFAHKFGDLAGLNDVNMNNGSNNTLPVNDTSSDNILPNFTNNSNLTGPLGGK